MPCSSWSIWKHRVNIPLSRASPPQGWTSFSSGALGSRPAPILRAQAGESRQRVSTGPHAFMSREELKQICPQARPWSQPLSRPHSAHKLPAPARSPRSCLPWRALCLLCPERLLSPLDHSALFASTPSRPHAASITHV
ncbi:unnamed protein product [Pipistrellus nathusii]|uniref:Uncharacterized protein n=1 Tax=Pipistrellus nathusii TaxID=59473 RepID=A0ABP0A9L8_PIPNA